MRRRDLASHFAEHTVCQWLGNSQAVARTHYLRTTDADFAKAAGVAEKSDVKSDVTNPEKATQKATRQLPAACGTLGNVVQKCLEANGFAEVFPAIRQLLGNLSMTPRGLEPLSPP